MKRLPWGTFSTVEGYVTGVEWYDKSRHRNPRYRVTIQATRHHRVTLLTEIDGQVGYAATNYRGRHVRAALNEYGHIRQIEES